MTAASAVFWRRCKHACACVSLCVCVCLCVMFLWLCVCMCTIKIAYVGAQTSFSLGFMYVLFCIVRHKHTHTHTHNPTMRKHQYFNKPKIKHWHTHSYKFHTLDSDVWWWCVSELRAGNDIVGGWRRTGSGWGKGDWRACRELSLCWETSGWIWRPLIGNMAWINTKQDLRLISESLRAFGVFDSQQDDTEFDQQQTESTRLAWHSTPPNVLSCVQPWANVRHTTTTWNVSLNKMADPDPLPNGKDPDSLSVIAEQNL